MIEFDAACARKFGEVHGRLLRGGVSVSPIDLMIAATALAHDITLVTHNVKDFERVPGLRIVDWLDK